VPGLSEKEPKGNRVRQTVSETRPKPVPSKIVEKDQTEALQNIQECGIYLLSVTNQREPFSANRFKEHLDKVSAI
jgi:hypothetical protein